MQLKKVKIGDVLVNAGLITAAQLSEALKLQQTTGAKLGKLFIDLKFIDENTLLQSLANQLQIPLIDLSNETLDIELIKKIPERLARRYRLILIAKNGLTYTIGMSDPTDLSAYDEISKLLGGQLNVAVVRELELMQAIDLHYRHPDEVAAYAKALKIDLNKGQENKVNTGAELENTPVDKLIDSIFNEAIQLGASDVHIEPEDSSFRIRQRVDGLLQETVFDSKEILSALVLKIKLLAKLNISEKRLPQDGRLQVKIKAKILDIRVSCLPTKYGESVVMRILDQSNGILNLEQIGLSPILLAQIRSVTQRANGMVIVTGPTGSGKTSTLYALLNELNDLERKIITIEDPIEYSLAGVNQVQTNSQIGLNFAEVLRAVLRQDPDIIMIGEMRDQETVQIGLRAAMTGHMVLATMHTNDAPSTPARLIDMGAAPFLVANSLRAIIAQRLVRRLCLHCQESHVTSVEAKEWIKKELKLDAPEQFKQGKGCKRCRQTGYKGRIGIYEYLAIDHNLRADLSSSDFKSFQLHLGQNKHYKALFHSAYELAVLGLTSLAEALKIAAESKDTSE